MEWRKIKNIILLILLGLNAALAILIGAPALADRYREAQANRDAVDFLTGKGIQLDGVQFSDPAELPARTATRDREGEARVAKALLGENTEQEARGGEVYRYTSPAGMIQFHSDGSFWAELTHGAFPVGENAQNAVLELMKRLEFDAAIIDDPDGSDSAVSLRQVWGGAHLFNQQALVSWDDTGITAITSARRLYGQPEEDSDRETITLATALIDFYNGLNRLGDVCSRVDEITPGYLSTTSLNRQMELTPVWRITTDTGAYQIDLVSGEVERVS